MALASEPEFHYDRVTAAWNYLIGEDLHFGYFAGPAGTLPEATQALTQIMAQRASVSAGMEVLDVGCGTGHPALFLARQLGCHVTGISTSRVCVEQAQRRAAALGVGDIRFQVADGTAMDFAGQSFDCVWVMETAHLIAQKDRLLRECVRVLRPGGRLALCDIVLRREIPLAEVLKLRRDLMTLQVSFGRAKLEPFETYARLVRELGLRAEIEDISERVVPTVAHWRRNAELHAAEVEQILGPEELRDFRQSCDILTRFWQEGRLGYILLVATKPGRPAAKARAMHRNGTVAGRTPTRRQTTGSRPGSTRTSVIP
jgi:27-O-demethylrifamycin SV methyltransferase